MPSSHGDPQPTFSCHRCGACCTDLRERATDHGFAETAPGVYRRATEGGLRLFAWEAEAFPDDRLRPALVVADDGSGQQLALTYELAADTCPHFDAEASACTIYEDRPLVCRAFPLLVEPDDEGLAVAASSVCGARVPLAELDGEDREAALAASYPQAAPPALAVPALLDWLLGLAGFLARAGVLDPAEGLTPAELDGFEAVSIVDRLVDEGVLTRAEIAHRVRAFVDDAGRRETSVAADA